MQNVLIRTGHGYEESTRGRCEAFDDFEIVAAPLGEFDNAARESRHWPKSDGLPGVTYDSYALKLGRMRSDRALYILIHHGAGREVWRVPEFYDGGDLQAHILAMPERLQYALLLTMWNLAREARDQGARETSAKWAQAYADKRIRRRRATKTRGARIEIVPQREIDLKNRGGQAAE
jgi:hypothetical protein